MAEIFHTGASSHSSDDSSATTCGRLEPLPNLDAKNDHQEELGQWEKVTSLPNLIVR